MTKKYITTPIYYVNDKPHIGHAYTTLACDVLARFYRLDGAEVTFLTGTDEHGQKVEKSAEKAGRSPQLFVDEVSDNFRKLADFMNFSHDDFIRTTEERHKKAVHALWNTLFEKGDIYLDKYAGWYSVRDEAFYAETELVDGKAPTGADVEWVEEASYFFKLSKYQDRLIEYYKSHADFILPISRRNEVMSFVEGGLKDLSVSRTTFSWGVDVPNDPDHVVYVWLDALTNYLTAIGYPDKIDEDLWTSALHMVGKDIVRFHAVYWPAFLMAADIPLPDRIFAHGWWTNEGQKISKSVGNVIDPFELVETYGLDQVRYFLLREVPFGNDGDFSRAGILNRLNTELANDLGNLAQRVLSFVHKHCEEKFPEKGSLESVDQSLLDAVYSLPEEIRPLMDIQQFNKVLDVIWLQVRAANKYVDEQAPWGLRKTDLERMKTVLYVLCEVIRVLGVVLQPFMPQTMSKLLDIYGIDVSDRMLESVKVPLVEGAFFEKPEPLFPRLKEEECS